MAKAATPEVDLCDYSEPGESADSLSDDILSNFSDHAPAAKPNAAVTCRSHHHVQQW